MASGETLTDVNGTPMGTNTNPMFATLVENGVGENVKTSGTTLTGIDGNVQGTTANPLIVKIQDGTTPVDPNPIKVSGTTLTDIYGEPVGTNANPLILKTLGGDGKRVLEGTFTTGGSSVACNYYNNTVAGTLPMANYTLPFKASKIILTKTGNTPHMTVYQSVVSNVYTELVTVGQHNINYTSSTNYAIKGNSNGVVINATGFVLPVYEHGTYIFTAYE